MSFNELQQVTDLVKDIVNNEQHRLVDNVEELEEQRETNEFLEDVAEDYKRYHNIMIEQNKQQQKQLLGILDYLDSLMETQAITKYTLDHAYNEQKRIVGEIKELQNEMDQLY